MSHVLERLGGILAAYIEQHLFAASVSLVSKEQRIKILIEGGLCCDFGPVGLDIAPLRCLVYDTDEAHRSSSVSRKKQR
jgi:hypothetical protein